MLLIWPLVQPLKFSTDGFMKAQNALFMKSIFRKIETFETTFILPNILMKTKSNMAV